MNPETLRKTLTDLHAELSQVTALDDTTRQRLQLVISDLQRLVQPNHSVAGQPEDADASLIQTLQNAVSSFEARHPQLTASVQQIIDRLSEIGI